MDEFYYSINQPKDVKLVNNDKLIYVKMDPNNNFGTDSILIDPSMFDKFSVIENSASFSFTVNYDAEAILTVTEQFNMFVEKCNKACFKKSATAEEATEPDLGALSWKLPGADQYIQSPCPKTCQYYDDRASLRWFIMHLNDDHKWTREQIADWIETLDIDTRFKINSPDKKEVLN